MEENTLKMEENKLEEETSKNKCTGVIEAFNIKVLTKAKSFVYFFKNNSDCYIHVKYSKSYDSDEKSSYILQPKSLETLTCSSPIDITYLASEKRSGV